MLTACVAFVQAAWWYRSSGKEIVELAPVWLIFITAVILYSLSSLISIESEKNNKGAFISLGIGLVVFYHAFIGHLIQAEKNSQLMVWVFSYPINFGLLLGATGFATKRKL